MAKIRTRSYAILSLEPHFRIPESDFSVTLLNATPIKWYWCVVYDCCYFFSFAFIHSFLLSLVCVRAHTLCSAFNSLDLTETALFGAVYAVICSSHQRVCVRDFFFFQLNR